AGLWWWNQRADAARSVERMLAESHDRHTVAWGGPAGETAGFQDAVVAAKQAVNLAKRGPTPRVWRERADLAFADATAQLDAAHRDARLLTRALDVRNPRETWSYVRDTAKGSMVLVNEPDADEQFRAAFADCGLSIDERPL